VEQDNAHGDLNIRMLIVIGLLSAVLLVEIVVVAQAYFYNAQEAEIAVKQLSQPSWELSDLLLAQQSELNSYRWVDREKQRVSIPIDRAIQQFVQNEARKAATRPASKVRK
jgi:hypothetical protein